MLGSARGAPLAGTKPLVGERDYASDMVDGIDRFLVRRPRRGDARGHVETGLVVARAYEQWWSQTARLAKMIGVVGRGNGRAALELVATTTQPASVGAAGAGTRPRGAVAGAAGVHGEGLLLARPRAAVADVVALPDADQTPEKLAGWRRASRPSRSSPGGWPRAAAGCSSRP